MSQDKMTLSPVQCEALLATLKARFETNMNRQEDTDWSSVQAALEANPEKLWSLHEMERTGGEPDIVGYDDKTSEYVFYDCSPESPTGRRSLCYDRDALESRRKHKPDNSAMDMASEMGVELLTEGAISITSEAWTFRHQDIELAENPGVRQGARWGHLRYYSARGFRGALRV